MEILIGMTMSTELEKQCAFIFHDYINKDDHPEDHHTDRLPGQGGSSQGSFPGFPSDRARDGCNIL